MIPHTKRFRNTVLMIRSYPIWKFLQGGSINNIGAMLNHFSGRLCQPGVSLDPTVWLDGAKPQPKKTFPNV
jgi:hypothetical protein